jgi:hypothetical protein
MQASCRTTPTSAHPSRGADTPMANQDMMTKPAMQPRRGPVVQLRLKIVRRTASPQGLNPDFSMPSKRREARFSSYNLTGNRRSGCSTRQSPASVAEAPSMHARMHDKRSSVIHWRTFPVLVYLQLACCYFCFQSSFFFFYSLLFTHLHLCSPLVCLFYLKKPSTPPSEALPLHAPH